MEGRRSHLKRPLCPLFFNSAAVQLPLQNTKISSTNHFLFHLILQSNLKMAHRRLQNIPVQDGSNRPISPTGPIRSSPRLAQSRDYVAWSHIPGNRGYRSPLASPTKRNVPYATPATRAPQHASQQPAMLTPICGPDTLEWSHSVSTQSLINHGIIPSPSIFAPRSPPQDTSPHVNVHINPAIMQNSTILAHGSTSSGSFPNKTYHEKHATASGKMIEIDDDDDEFPCDIFDSPRVVVRQQQPPLVDPYKLPERNFEIQFNVYQLKVPESDTIAGRTKKARGRSVKIPPKPVKAQWTNFKPLVPLYQDLPVGSFSWPVWRAKLFDACNLRLAGISEALIAAEKTGFLAIQGFINGYSAERKKPINFKIFLTDDVTFGQFVTTILGSPADAKILIKITHPNPKTNEAANRSLASTLNQSGTGANDPSDASSEDNGSESDGSDALTAAEKNYKKLMARFESAFKSGENVATAINPKDPSQVVLLSTARIRTWANDWADGVPGVNEVNPPMARPGFKWVNASDYESEKANLLGTGDRRNQNSPTSGSKSGATVIHHNYYGQGFPSPGMAGLNPFTTPNMPMHPPPSHPDSNTSSLIAESRLSPLPSGEYPAFDDFLAFAGIHEGKKKTRDALYAEGIDEFERLLDRATYSIANLRSLGIPFAHAEDIFKAVPKYLDQLKNKV